MRAGAALTMPAAAAVCLYGYPPFADDITWHSKPLAEQIIHGVYNFPEDNPISPEGPFFFFLPRPPSAPSLLTAETGWDGAGAQSKTSSRKC